MSKPTASVITLVVLLGVSALEADATPILSIRPPTTTVGLTDTFFLDIDIEGVDDLFAYEITVDFDTNVLTFLESVNGGFLGSDTETLFFTCGANQLIPCSDSQDAGAVQTRFGFPPTGVSGNGSLFRLMFNAIALGNTPVTFRLVDLRNSNAQRIAPVATRDGVVNVVVPEPSTLTLLAIGLAALRVRLRNRPRRTDALERV